MQVLRSLPVFLLLVCSALLSMNAFACTPTSDGQLKMASLEDEATAVLKQSESVYVGYLVSVAATSRSDGTSNRIAQFKVKNVLRGESHTSLRFLESTCGSPFAVAQPVNSGQALVILAKDGQLLKAYPEASTQGRTIRLAFVSRIGQTLPASKAEQAK
jgi:hypothetical protein